ncbi:MAG: hypothetical protein ACRCZY_10260 [Phocaeicola sp.]
MSRLEHHKPLKLAGYIMLLIVAVGLHACTPLTFGSEEHKGNCKLAFNYNWGGEVAPPTGEMRVVSNRVMNITRYYEGWNFIENVPFIPSDKTWETIQHDSIAASDSVYCIVDAGEYQFITLSYDYPNLQVNTLYDYLTDIEHPSSYLSASVKGYSKPQLDGADYDSWISENSAYKYMMPLSSPLYVAITHASVAHGTTQTISFTPKRLTQEVNVQLTIQPESGIEIERVMGEISGICPQIQLTTGYLSVAGSQSLKVLLDYQLTHKGNNQISCNSTTHLLGLINSLDPFLGRGPGVLWMAVTASLQENGKLYRKTFNARFNLHNVLVANPSIEKVVKDGVVYYKQCSPHYSLTIGSPLLLTKKEMLQGVDTSVGDWNKEDGILDVE